MPLFDPFHKATDAAVPGAGAPQSSSSLGRSHVAKTALTYAPAAMVGNLITTPVALQEHVVERKAWQNYAGTQVAQPMEIWAPQSIGDLKDVLAQAAAAELPVRAVGSGHAWSDAALTDGYTVETNGLAQVLELDETILRNPVDAATLIYSEAGITISQLNDVLSSRNLALINMGGFDGQTLAGVISTSTHGSGITLGSYSSMVEALVMVTASGDVVQIEKRNGISDPARFETKYGSQRTLVQNDQRFEAAVVSMGCLGIVYAVILRVTQKYWLSEVRTLLSWTEAQNQLKAGILDRYRHVEVLINPYKVKSDDYLCLLTTRDLGADPVIPSKPRPLRYAFADFFAEIPDAGALLTLLFNRFPHASPEMLDSALQDLEDTNPYVDLSFRIFNIGHANGFRAISAEFGIDIDAQFDAANAVIAAANQYAAAGAYHSSPIAMRWVAPSPGMMSMQPRTTCMMEFPMLYDVFGSDGLLWRYEGLLTRQFAARPHWGQCNFLNGSQETMRRLYPRFDEWMGVYKAMDPNGRFRSRFTDRIGITS